MGKLPRRPPSGIPAIHPVPEYAASGERAEGYADMKAVLQVPWMGVVTMAYAHYPTFFRELWRGLRPLCLSRPFVESAREVRALAETGVKALAPPPVAARLREAGYAQREINDIRNIIEVFSHGNPLYLLIATIARLLLERGEMSSKHEAPPFAGQHAPAVHVPFVLMEAHHADAPTQAIYEDIKATLQLPFVNTDYRALARWPSYFALAWSDLKEIVQMPAHEIQCEAVHTAAATLAQSLPNPGGLTPVALKNAAERDASLSEIVEVSRLFQHLLPGLIVNVAVFREQLANV
ncbi:MAG: halocarboxylic acid dehydrogenase DehI family protein [Acidiferrobacterales bacterium]